MNTKSLSELFRRDLRRLADEIGQYENEPALWEIRGAISNSAGTLCLHLTGNLQHFIGAVLGGTGYVRDRPNEFAARNVPRQQLLAEVETTLDVVERSLGQLAQADLEKDYPLEMFGKVQKMDFMLMHLYGHLNYHLGQINYHRRLVGM